jgi:hypothetical protein
VLHTELWNKPALLAAAAALSAAGLLATPIPAHALPAVPLAPANCQQWAFPGFTTLHVSEANFDFQFTSNEPTVNGTVTRLGVDDSGNITGGIDRNGHVDLNISQGTASLRFIGDVSADGKARGTWSGNPQTARWETTAPLRCDIDAPQGANSQMVTVSKDSDVYDTPQGNRLEAPFFLPVGRKYASVSPCADNWCLLNIPELPGGAHGGLPAGQAWAYSSEGFLDVK